MNKFDRVKLAEFMDKARDESEVYVFLDEMAEDGVFDNITPEEVSALPKAALEWIIARLWNRK